MTSLLLNIDKDIPNPGTYEKEGATGAIRKDGKYPCSKYQNAKGYTFGIKTDSRLNIRLGTLIIFVAFFILNLS